MMKSNKKNFIQTKSVVLQTPLKQLFIGLLKRLMISVRGLWLPIYRIERSGLTLILIGHEACDPLSDKVCDPYMIALLFSEYVEPIRIGVVPLWSLNRVMRRWEKNADLIIFRHRKFQPEGAFAYRMLRMPFYVAQFVDLPPAEADLLTVFRNSKTRDDFRRIRKANFQYEVTRDPAQLDFFYHQMYLPYIQDRHGESVRSMPWIVFRQYYEKMELLLIRKGEEAVAGCLNLQTGDCYTGHVLGVLNGDKELVTAGCISACYWFSIVEAHRRGCSTFDMQCARPFLKNGVLAYKKKWGSRIAVDHTDGELWLMPCSNRPSLQRFLEDNPFICEQDGRIMSLIFLGSHMSLNDKELSDYLQQCHYSGDRLSICVVLLTSEWAARAQTIENILCELPTSSQILDLSQDSLAGLQELISSRLDSPGRFSIGFRQLAYAQ